MKWRPMRSADIIDVKAIADVVHLDFPEDELVFAERRSLYPSGCAVLVAGRRVLGYCLSHPWLTGHVPPLNSLLRELPERPDTLYIHDVALLPQARGQNAVPPQLERLELLARLAGYRHLTLTAVGNSARFWMKNGFDPIDMGNNQEELVGYGSSALCMQRRVPPC